MPFKTFVYGMVKEFESTTKTMEFNNQTFVHLHGSCQFEHCIPQSQRVHITEKSEQILC